MPSRIANPTPRRCSLPQCPFRWWWCAWCLYRVFNQTTSVERQDVSHSRTLASLPYKTSPVPAPIRRSFDTQLSNQDLARVFGNDERRLVWIDERFQQRRVATVFIHQFRRCRLRKSMDDQTFQRRADLHLVRVSREPNKYRIQKIMIQNMKYKC